MITKEDIEFQLDWIDDLKELGMLFLDAYDGGKEPGPEVPEMRERLNDRKSHALLSYEAGRVDQVVRTLSDLMEIVQATGAAHRKATGKYLREDFLSGVEAAKMSLTLPAEDVAWAAKYE